MSSNDIVGMGDGYGYGIWLVVENEELQKVTKHIAHITLVCNMNLENAKTLFKKIEETFLYEIPEVDVELKCDNKEGILFETSMYSSNESNLLTKYAWGYYIDHKDLNLTCIEDVICKYMIENDFCGSISPKLHITIDYDQNINSIIKKLRKSTYEEILKCSVKLVDIRSAQSMDWEVIESI